MKFCGLGTATFQDQRKGQQIDTKCQIRIKITLIEEFVNYMKEFSKSFNYYLVENKSLLQQFKKIPLVNNFGGEGKQSHSMIILYKTIFTTLDNTKNQLLTKTQDFRNLIKLHLTQFYDYKGPSYKKYRSNNERRTCSRQYSQIDKTETDSSNYFLNPLRKIMSLCSPEEYFENQIKKRISFQHPSKSNQNSLIRQFQNNIMLSQKKNNIVTKTEEQMLSEYLFKQTNQYCNSIIFTLSYLFAHTNQETKNLLFILEKPLNLFSKDQKLFEYSQNNLNLDQIHKKLSNKLFINSQIWVISGKIIQYEQLITDKLKSLRISCKIIVDALVNIVISLQRFINYSKNIRQVFKSKNRILEQIDKTIQIINKIIDFGLEFVQKSLVETNNLVLIFHNINNTTQQILSNFTSVTDISKFNDMHSKFNKQKVQMITEVFLNKIQYLKRLPQSKIQSIQNLQNKFREHFKNVAKYFDSFTSSANNLIKSFYQTPSLIKDKNSNNIFTCSNSQQLQQEQKISLNISIDKIIASSSKIIERSNSVMKLIHPLRGQVLKKQVFQKTSLIHLINLLFKNKLYIQQEQFNCFYQFYQKQCGDEKTIISKWDQNIEYFVTEDSLQQNTPLQFKRHISFDHPIGGFKLPFLPRCCKSVQDQTLYIVDSNRAILDIQVNSRQAPYTDCFQVIMRFQFKQSNGNVELTINSYVNWIKSTLMKAIIQSQTIKQITQSVTLFCELVNKVLKFQPYKPIRKQKKITGAARIPQQQKAFVKQSITENIQYVFKQQNVSNEIEGRQVSFGLRNYLFVVPVLVIFIGFTSVLNTLY